MLSRIRTGMVLTLLATFVSACGEMKKLDEMKDNTSDMRQTTKDLSNKTGDMKDGLEKMSKTTGEMNDQMKDLLTLTREELLARLSLVSGSTASLFDAMRQGDTSGLRRAGINELLKQTTLQGRLAEAGIYMQGFEFQVLGKVGHDAEQKFRDALYYQAVLEFFLKIEELAPKFGEVNPAAEPNLGNDEENRASAFNSIAFALHKINRQQLPDPTYGRPMSIYDLIIVALEMKPYIDRGQFVLPPGPHFIKEVLANQRRVEQLLQTRYNMFAYGLVGATTNLGEYGMLSKIWKLLWNVDIDLSEKRLGPAVLDRLVDEVVAPAARTTQDMLNVGIVPKLEGKTKFLLSSLKLQFNTPAKKGEFVVTTKREEVLRTLWKQYTKPKLDLYQGSRR